MSCVLSVLEGDELLQKFWKVESCDFRFPYYSHGKQAVINHFDDNYHHNEQERFIVPLPRKVEVEPLGETRTMAVRRLLSLEQSLRSKGKFKEFAEVISEYIQEGNAEQDPPEDLTTSRDQVFYLPVHVVCKETRTTTKLHVVFNASAKSSTGVSLNGQLLVVPTVHAQLLDVLMRFHRHGIA